MKRTDKIGVYLKLSCSALLLSGSLVGYGFTKDAFADSESTSSNVENTSNSNSIADKIQQAKDDIKDLKELSDADIKSFEERLDKVDNQSSIDRIINDAKDKNNHLKSTDSSATSSKTEDDDTSEKDNDDMTKDLDKILSDLDSIAKNVDNRQQGKIVLLNLVTQQPMKKMIQIIKYTIQMLVHAMQLLMILKSRLLIN